MFRRLFRGDQDDQRAKEQSPAAQEQETGTERPEGDLLAELIAAEPNPTGTSLTNDVPEATTTVTSERPSDDPALASLASQAQVQEPEAPKLTPLFSRIEELERSLQPAPAEVQRGLLRRLFGGEERTSEEIQREEHKTGQAVQKTRAGVFGRINEVLKTDQPLTDALWEELEELMIQADVGVDTTLDVIERVRRRSERENLRYVSQARSILKQEMVKLLEPNTRAYAKRGTKPWIILVVGVNGAGKTTLIAKIANRYKNEIGSNVLLAAADTFRAAAVEQLKTWADRIGVPVIAQGQNADPGAVAFDAVDAALARNVDVVIIDTAGRLQSKFNLMKELQKIANVVRKRVDQAPHEVLLVVDATTGQNGISQARAFMEASEVTHLALTKLDGTAKGGIAFAMVQQIQRPIKYIGTGEKLDDLALFDAQAFVDALFEEEVPA